MWAIALWLANRQVSSEALREILNGIRPDGYAGVLDRPSILRLPPVSILTRFRSLSVAAVVLAGLIDGVNPCAFATILFFVSYLAVSRRQRREMLLVGGAFALGVFVTYFAVGLGAMRLLLLVQAARGPRGGAL